PGLLGEDGPRRRYLVSPCWGQRYGRRAHERVDHTGGGRRPRAGAQRRGPGAAHLINRPDAAPAYDRLRQPSCTPRSAGGLGPARDDVELVLIRAPGRWNSGPNNRTIGLFHHNRRRGLANPFELPTDIADRAVRRRAAAHLKEAGVRLPTF